MSAIARAKELIDREIFFGGVGPGEGSFHITLPNPQDSQVGFKRLTETAILPVRAHATDSGFDLFADSDYTIYEGATGVISTGIAVVLPPGFEAQVRPRSGLSSTTKMRVVLGTVDNGYRGEISVIVDNIANPEYQLELRYDSEGEFVVGVGLHEDAYYSTIIRIAKGDKIAQLVVAPYYVGSSYEVKEELPETERGSNGFGSTGYGTISEL